MKKRPEEWKGQEQFLIKAFSPATCGCLSGMSASFCGSLCRAGWRRCKRCAAVVPRLQGSLKPILKPFPVAMLQLSPCSLLSGHPHICLPSAGEVLISASFVSEAQKSSISSDKKVSVAGPQADGETQASVKAQEKNRQLKKKSVLLKK